MNQAAQPQNDDKEQALIDKYKFEINELERCRDEIEELEQEIQALEKAQPKLNHLEVHTEIKK